MEQGSVDLEIRKLRIERLCYCPELVPLNDNGVVHCTPGEPLPLEECATCPLLMSEEEVPSRLRKRREQAIQLAATRKLSPKATYEYPDDDEEFDEHEEEQPDPLDDLDDDEKPIIGPSKAEFDDEDEFA